MKAIRAASDFNFRTTKAIIRDYRESFLESLSGREGVCDDRDTDGATVWWIQRFDDLFRPCWVSIVPYNTKNRLIRIRSGSECELPQKAWRYPRPPHGALSAFQFTFHPEELAERPIDIAAVHDLIFGFSCVRDFLFASALFTEADHGSRSAFSIRAGKVQQEGANEQSPGNV